MKEILMSHFSLNIFRIALGLLLILGSVVFSAGVKAQETQNQLDKADTFAGKSKKSPNILFVVMDDVGVDQMKLYGYGASPEPAQTPAIDALAARGVVFANAWAMPDCSPSRATFWEGRWPIRTQVLNPIQPPDLANSQVSPDEVTVPRLLRKKGYISGLFGKMHLSGSNQDPANNPLGNEVYRKLGFDHFEGYLEGAPLSIDTTAGGVGSSGDYLCGFVPNLTTNPSKGADYGACYYADNTCEVLTRSPSLSTPGRTCMERGGLLDPGQASCQSTAPSHLNFATQNGYYTANVVINDKNGNTIIYPPQDPTGRMYRSTFEANKAIAWINEQKLTPSRPWMATVGFSSAHSPWHNVPSALLPENSADSDGFNCVGSSSDKRTLMKQMIEGMDHEFERLLVETGLATRGIDDKLKYQPEKTNTVIVVVGDNGSYLTVVNEPFDPSRSKGTPYQTGVWVPLVISGANVVAPGRKVTSMVNTIDLFQLFSEIAGVDPREYVPRGRPLDAEPMLAYLTKRNQKSIRTTNFTQTGDNIRSSIAPPSPCVVDAANVCTSFFPTKAICEKNSGTWWGTGNTIEVPPQQNCCGVNSYRVSQSEQPYQISAVMANAMRDDNYKLVRTITENCASPSSPITTDELYLINEARTMPLLDTADRNLLANGVEGLNKTDKKKYNYLSMRMRQLLSTYKVCPGDGNLDAIVNLKDVAGWKTYSVLNGGQSSWFDFNYDGKTDNTDLGIIYANWQKRCPQG
jgi:hypothetical protein